DNQIAEYVRKQIDTEFGGDNPVTKNLFLTVQVINFGDGTGYIIGRPYPSNRQIGLVLPKEPKIPALNAPNLICATPTDSIHCLTKPPSCKCERWQEPTRPP